MIQFDGIVIGGGPAGMFAAITAANWGQKVLLLERNDRLGKKLLITGKGRCNVTNHCGADEVLRNVPKNGRFLYSAMDAFPPERIMHFFEENKRVDLQAQALASNDFEAFKALIVDSGYSSYMYNQNVFSSSAPLSQPVSLALAISEVILKGKGAWRVHGGGFAGTIQAFVPNELLDEYKESLEAVFGEGACYVLAIRPFGGTEI